MDTIALSNGGANTFRSYVPCKRLVIGTMDRVAILERSGDAWRLADRALEGCAIPAVAQLASGTRLAATHGLDAAAARLGAAG